MAIVIAAAAAAAPRDLERDVRTIVADFGPRDHQHPENLERVAAYIEEALKAAGARVIAADISWAPSGVSSDDLDFAGELRDNESVLVETMDITLDSHVRAVYERAMARFGTVDVLSARPSSSSRVSGCALGTTCSRATSNRPLAGTTRGSNSLRSAGASQSQASSASR